MRGDATLAVLFIISLRVEQWVVGNTPQWASGVRIGPVSFLFLVRLSLPLNVNFQPECVLVELALNAYGKVGVTLYDTLGDEAVGAFVRLKDWIHPGTNLDTSQNTCKIHKHSQIMNDLTVVQYRPCAPYPYLHNL
jgi:hypothetical protein